MVDGGGAAPVIPLEGFGRHGHTVEVIRTGKAALRRHHRADLVLLDTDLPDVDGIEVCRLIRAQSDVPIMILASRGSELDLVRGLRAGSDDYLVTPVGFRELVARMEAVTRRSRVCVAPRRSADDIVLGRLRIDVWTRGVLVDGRPVDVTRKEFDLLHVLASQPRTVISRHQLMTAVWNTASRATGSRTLDTHVNSLRRKLGGRDWIVTVRGVGFRMGTGADGSGRGAAGPGSGGVVLSVG
ncbi:response regulator transcription factor [Streptomyces sp. B1866]|uniref:response regulator transcription factor n=1 Tax=Streptomyces sp. B1866 TaxID=3075431 RepID=UPI00288E06FF|nr:response regulator transcription factor [Streptomyces sp. B1866]MDT3395519.1 response regulator transcription factor [Streptomyces sp. B1866]